MGGGCDGGGSSSPVLKSQRTKATLEVYSSNNKCKEGECYQL